MVRIRHFAPVLVALSLAAPVQAQQADGPPPVFSSDRPGFANSTAVAASGRLTTELGANVGFDDRSTSVDLPNLWFRTGILDWLEARLRAPDAHFEFQRGETDAFGLDDLGIGFKVGGKAGETVQISSDWELYFPLGTDGFGTAGTELRADVQLDWSFSDRLTLTPNAVASVRTALDPTTDREVRYFEGGGSLKLTWQVLDVLAVFAQAYSLDSRRRPLSVVVGGGLYGMVRPNWQLDASFDAGVLDQDLPPTISAGTTVLW